MVYRDRQPAGTQPTNAPRYPLRTPGDQSIPGWVHGPPSGRRHGADTGRPAAGLPPRHRLPFLSVLAGFPSSYQFWLDIPGETGRQKHQN